MENNYGKVLTEKINDFSKKSSYIYIVTFLSLLSILSIYIRIFLLDYTVFNFINLGIGIFTCFLIIRKIKVKETTNLNNKSIILILIGVLTYNIVFGMIGFPLIPFISNSFFGNLILYTLISYILFIYFCMKNNKKFSGVFFKIFIVFSILDLILPFLLLFLKGE